MKTTTFLLFLCGFFICPNLVHGRVGETEAQVDHRFGKPVGKWDDYIGYRKLYHWHGFDVMVTFVDGVSQREMFNKSQGYVDAHDYKVLKKVGGADQNGIVFDKAGVFTTKEFGEKYDAAKQAAWSKSNQKQQQQQQQQQQQ
ncbi:MAG TPA: hypothetical protein VKS98_04615 [Chthoniobacterales bacterium]|nr:hypothetical protein [Chthoniobacterales bacterium]